MLGIVNKAIENFVIDSYGKQIWKTILKDSSDIPAQFEAMLHYDNSLSYKTLRIAASKLSKDHQDMLEDLGVYLVCHNRCENLRRLLRFSGSDFISFLMSLDDFNDRISMALPDLNIPKISIEILGDGRFHVIISNEWVGFSHVFVGVMRAMADDFGTLVFIEKKHNTTQFDRIEVVILDANFSIPKEFQLGTSLS